MFLDTFLSLSIGGNMTRNFFCQNVSLHLPYPEDVSFHAHRLQMNKGCETGISVNEGEEKHWHAVASTDSCFPVPISVSQHEGYHPAPGVLINAFCTGQQEAVRKLKGKCWLLHFFYRRCSFLDWQQPSHSETNSDQRTDIASLFFSFFFLKYHPSPLKNPSLVHCVYLDVFCTQASSCPQENKTALCYCCPEDLASQIHSRERM